MKLLLTALLKNAQELADPRNWPRLPGDLWHYLRTRRRFRRASGGEFPVRSMPILFERVKASSFDPHYAYQAYWAISRICAGPRPLLHADVSSNVAFTAGLAGVVPVVQVEFRPPRLRMSGFCGVRGDIRRLPFPGRSLPSLTCLHVVEHVGLGRYGDPVDPEAWKGALAELQRVVAPGGNLFLSTPVGRPAVHFNGNYVFSPTQLQERLGELRLREFCWVDDQGAFHEDGAPDAAADMDYALGMFWFVRPVGE